MKRTGNRRGILLLEVLVAIVLLTALAGVLVEALAARSAQQRAVAHRSRAALQAGNLMERIALLPWNELSDERLAELAQRDDPEPVKSSFKCGASVAQRDDEPDSKRVTVEVLLPARAAHDVPPVRLTAWFFRQPAPTTAEAAP